jgi:uncharacterized protein
MSSTEPLNKEKDNALRQIFREMGSVAIAFSGGVDSTYMLAAAHEELGDRAAALTAVSEVFPDREQKEAEEFCKANGIRQIRVPIRALDTPGFRENPKDRCYLCKKAIFSRLKEIAAENGFNYVAEGSNMDDLDDYRPGRRAIEELGVKSPLLEAGMTKRDIRELSTRLGLSTSSKPSAACLASRFAYGELITDEGLAMVGAAEAYLQQLGFEQVRVRIHGKLARIEVAPDRVPELVAEPMRGKVIHRCKVLGFQYVTLDLAGYRMGSMNEML